MIIHLGGRHIKYYAENKNIHTKFKIAIIY